MRFRTVKVRITFYNIFKKRPKRVVFSIALSWLKATARVDGYPVVHLTSILLLFLLVSYLLYINSLLVISQLLLFIPPSPKTPYFSIQ